MKTKDELIREKTEQINANMRKIAKLNIIINQIENKYP